MKLGMCMLLWTTHLTEDAEPLLRDIKASGFDGVEVPVFEGEVGHYQRLGALLDRIGLQRTAIAAMGDPAMNLIGDDAERKAGIAHMHHVLDCTAAVGAKVVSGPVHSTLGGFSGQGPTKEEFRRSVSSQRAIGDHAAKVGVTVGLEALNRFECYIFNTMEVLCAHLDEVGHPNIKAMYDTFHCNIEENDPIAAYTDSLRHVVHVHLSENNRGVPGRGNIPWAETFRAIKASGYDDWLTIESFGRGLPDLAAATKVWRDFCESPEAVYREGGAFIRKGWAAA
ncbi:MAG: isomerase [Cereibacter sphaeroides]|uniref:Isomerase n=1 Tax=Cereibacter sphaeroides TaxID=1063 RepID=A0A2W5S977_CERSP|nr:MAG: isomerase [Cereibacter sphaeroides]